MSLDVIKKRNGDVVSFDPNKISYAIKNAARATKTEISDEAVADVTNSVVEAAGQVFIRQVPGVENIQDIVEQKIAEKGFFPIARAYIVYREHKKEEREQEQQELLEKMKKHQLTITKRNGDKVPFDVMEVTAQLTMCAADLREEIDIPGVVNEALGNLYEGVETSEINKALVMALKARIERNPAYSKVAASVLFNDMYREIIEVNEGDRDFEERYRKGFLGSIQKGIEAGRLDKRMLDFNFAKLADAINPERDHIFWYLGAQTLYDRYFVRDLEQNILELPQYFWMRVAMGLAVEEQDKEGKALEFYEAMSTLHYVPSTPTLFHSGTTRPQMSSCYLTTVDDDLSHIFKSYGDNAQLSKYTGGLGNDWTNIRATGALIKSTNVGSQGVIPFLKIADATTAAINRSGKRRGATCVYLETWHLDIEDFLDLRKNTGDERRRTHDLNTANWIPDLFMKRVMADAEWTLFSPHETPDLHDSYGQDFERKYEAYEKAADEGKIETFKRMSAKKLWRQMLTRLFDSGHPWVTFKDPCNIRSPQDHVGVVHSSNLCTEITLNTSVEETAVCNLGSVNLPQHIVGGKLDRDLVAKTTKTAMRMLDNVIDLNFYPTPEAKNANMKHRPVGMGIMGVQDALYMMDMPFGEEEAVKWSDETMEFISYHAIMTSSELAKERGKYESYTGSKWDRDLFPIDTLKMMEKERGIETGIDTTEKLDWAPVREHVKKYGMRNSNCMAIAPTATISNIAGAFPSIEPIYKNVYAKSNVSGEFTVVNRYLVEELQERGLWDEEMLEKIKHSDGSVQPLNEVPSDLKAKFKEVFEIDPIWILKHAAARGKWIDQSQSVNIFMKTTSGKLLSEVYANAWKMGLKTTYYLRSLGASAIEKSSLDIIKHDAAPEAQESTPVPEAPVATPEPAPIMAAAAPAPPKLHVVDDPTCEACQ